MARRRVGALALLTLFGGLSIAEMAVLSAAQVGGSSTPSISTNAYLGMMTRRCANLDALAQLLEDAQYTYLPMLPPAADFGMTAQGWLTPFNFTNLPSGFDLEHLTVEQRHGIMVVPLTIAQDTAHNTVFLNSQGDVLYTMPPPAGYDPVAWLLAWRPNLVYSLAAAASTNAWLSLHDPAKVQLKVQLIAMDDVVPYLLAVAEAQQEAQQQASLMMQTLEETNPPPYTPPDTLTILSISVDSNGANLTVGYASNSLSGYHHFIMAISDLLSTNWVPLGNDLNIGSANPYLWTDTTANATNESMNFCMILANEPPSPIGGGGGTNTWTNLTTIARFYRALAVDPLADSDGDGMPDWWEMKYFSGLTNAVAGADANNNSVDNLSEYLLGHNPLEVVVPDPNGALALQVYTPLSTSP